MSPILWNIFYEKASTTNAHMRGKIKWFSSQLDVDSLKHNKNGKEKGEMRKDCYAPENFEKIIMKMS